MSKRYLVLSDIHLGHKRTPTTEIIDHLYKWLEDNKELVIQQDAIFIAGDLFDNLLEWASEDAIESSAFMNNLAKFCCRNDIALRILEGTPSHDWKQNKAIANNINDLEIPIDFKYIDKLHIEYMDKLEMYVLYVPDEWRPDPEDTYKEVLKLMDELGIDKVDIAIMHGQFGYQIPQAPDSIPKHNEEKYLNIVKHWINIGHIHTHSVYERIVAQGSFDRLSHNEEGPKGATFMTVGEEDTYLFKENPYAKVYKTVKIKLTDITDIMAKLDKVASKLPPYSHLRILVPRGSPVLTNIKDIELRYPLLNIKATTDKKEDTKEYILNTTMFDIEVNNISITPSSIKEQIREELGDKLNDYTSVFDEVMNSVI